MTEEKNTPSSKKVVLNLLLVVIVCFVLYQVFAISFPSTGKTTVVKSPDSAVPVLSRNIVQVDVLNGCGASGIGQKMTSLLRASGYDVVEMGNYKTFDVKQTLVIDRSGNIDVALNLAQKAKEQVPEEAHISDTLGWIYYKKNVPGTAITYLKEAADKMPDQPSVRYHLGMAYYKNGNRDLAKKELSAALKINSGFAGADEARATLNNLK